MSARGAVVMDADTGDVLWGQQADIPFAVLFVGVIALIAGPVALVPLLLLPVLLLSWLLLASRAPPVSSPGALEVLAFCLPCC